jgi:lipopolysaccharide/colanic/teichoic acid biosynthesis glycosyltransferase
MTTTDRDARETTSHGNHLRRYRSSGSGFARAPFFVSVSKPARASGVNKTYNRGTMSAGSGVFGQAGTADTVDRILPARTGLWTRFGKRAFDMMFSGLALLMLLPAFAFIALVIKFTSPGPVFFRQLRHGRDCRLFSIYKFRTMAVSQATGGVIQQTKENDERVSRFGAFLRRTSIDELPQLINVLLGDMSIVGPRPHAPLTAIGDTFFETLATTEKYRSRYDVRPGITGLAQVSGCRGAMWTRETAIRRLECDVDYVEKQSMMLDLKIIFRTFISEFLTGRAH